MREPIFDWIGHGEGPSDIAVETSSAIPTKIKVLFIIFNLIIKLIVNK